MNSLSFLIFTEFDYNTDYIFNIDQFVSSSAVESLWCISTALDVTKIELVYIVVISGITFDVKGEASIIAVDNGDHLCDDLFDGNKKNLYKGFAMAILRSGQKAGTVKLKVSAPGMKGIEKTFTVK